MSYFENKVIWITGASFGIGEALAKRLAAENPRLILSSRRSDQLERVRDEIQHAHPLDISILPFDLASPDRVNEAPGRAAAIYGHVDILINNGGISQRSMAVETEMQVYRQLMEVNFFSAVALTKGLLPDMIKRKSGHIVTISSVTGKYGSPWRTGYASSKHALHGFFDSLRAELFNDNIRVTLVTPGFVRTNISKNALTASGEKFGKMDEAQASGISPEKCADRIVKEIKTGKEEILIGKKEAFAVYIKRFFPGLFSRIIRKAKVR